MHDQSPGSSESGLQLFYHVNYSLWGDLYPTVDSHIAHCVLRGLQLLHMRFQIEHLSHGRRCVRFKSAGGLSNQRLYPCKLRIHSGCANERHHAHKFPYPLRLLLRSIHGEHVLRDNQRLYPTTNDDLHDFGPRHILPFHRIHHKLPYPCRPRPRFSLHSLWKRYRRASQHT